jgi:hypothetical protein
MKTPNVNFLVLIFWTTGKLRNGYNVSAVKDCAMEPAVGAEE